MNVGEPKIAALETVGQSLVIETKQMENGGLQIVNMHWIFRNGKAKLISLAIRKTGLHATACQHQAESIGEMVAS